MSLFIAWLTIIATVLGIKWSTYKSKKNIEKIRFMCNIFIIFLVILGCVYTIYYVYNYKREIKEKEIQDNIDFLDSYDDICLEIDDKNYKIAQKKIEIELNHIKNEEEYVQLNILKGICYFSESTNLIDVEKRSYCFDNVILIMKNLQSNSKKISNYQTVTINLLLGFSYIFLDYELYINDLNNIVRYFEKSIEDNTSVSCSDVFFFLGMFYEKKYYLEHKEEDVKNAIYYYEKAVSKSAEKDNVDLFTKNMNKWLEGKVAYFYLRMALINIEKKEEAKNYFNKAISIYDNVISSCNIKIDSDIYYESLKNQGRCYYMLSLMDKETKEIYTNKAYENFIKFIYMDEERYDSLIIGCYIFVGLDITEQDIDILLKRYNRLLNHYDELSDMENAATIRYDLAICYYRLADIYNVKEYYSCGSKMMQEIKLKYYEYFDLDQKDVIESLESKYSELEKNYNNK